MATGRDIILNPKSSKFRVHSSKRKVHAEFKVPDSEPLAPKPTRHTVVAIGLNVLLLALIVYGYVQSETLRWAWVLVGVPILIVTLQYVRHWWRG
jgi:hypothetical protein